MLDGTAAVKRFQSLMINERKSPHTVKEYTFIASMFMRFLSKPPEKASMEDIERFKSYMIKERGYSKASQYLAIKALKHFFRTLSIEPPPNLTAPRRSLKMPNYLSELEARKLIEASSSDSLNWAIVLILAHTGMRVSELCNLKTEDVDLDSHLIRIRGGKGDKDRIVLIPDDVSDLIRSYFTERLCDRISPYFIRSRRSTRIDSSTVERRIRNLALKAGITRKVTPHVLRHTFATSIMRNGGDIRFIQQLLGHASVATTQIYTHIDDESLRTLYSKYRPRY